MIFTLILILAYAHSSARAEDWPTLGASEQQCRGSLERSGATFSPAWTYQLDTGSIIATPVTSGGTVVVAASNGPVAALDARDGTVKWTRTLPGGVGATPVISNQQVAIPSLASTLYSLRLNDGETVWQRPFGGQNYASPLLVHARAPRAPDTLVIGAGFPQNDEWRFDARTGDPLWTTVKGDILDLVYSTAALAGDRVVFGMNGGRFQALDLATGKTAWKFDASGPVYLTWPLVVGNRVYAFPGDTAGLYAIDAEKGLSVAGFPVAIPDPAPIAGTERFGFGPAVSAPMTIDGLVIVQFRRQESLPSKSIPPPISMREYVAAIDPASATVQWQVLIASRVVQSYNGVPELNMCATPAGFSDGTSSFVAISSSISARLAVLEARTGTERWAAALSKPGRSSPVLSNGQLLVATDAGVLHAFSSTNHAPTPPSQVGPPGGEIPFSPNGVRLGWHGSQDVDGGPLSHVVRIEPEGHSEQSTETQTAPGEEALVVALGASTSYLVSVRSRDPQGALSPWSTASRVHVGDPLPLPPSEPSVLPASGTGPSPEGPSATGDVPSSGMATGPVPGSGPPAPSATPHPMPVAISITPAAGNETPPEGNNDASTDGGPHEETGGGGCTLVPTASAPAGGLFVALALAGTACLRRRRSASCVRQRSTPASGTVNGG
jgi:outer membrane protein assembly factor BamB